MFYALKMGEEYRARYLRHFAHPDIREHDLQHEELLVCQPNRLRWQPDMEAYLVCHLAAILPIGYLAYACDGDLRASTGEQRRLMWQASQEAFGLLRSQGIRILPEEDARCYGPGLRGALMRFVYLLMAKTVMGDLIACEHCRNAYEEMELLDRAFSNVIARTPDYPMPSWDELKAQMPDWAQVREQYGKL